MLDAPIDFNSLQGTNFRIAEGAFVNSKWQVREDRVGRRKVRPSYGGGMGNGKSEGDECNYQGVVAVEGMGSGWCLI